jgi:hypothetical protein
MDAPANLNRTVAVAMVAAAEPALFLPAAAWAEPVNQLLST